MSKRNGFSDQPPPGDSPGGPLKLLVPLIVSVLPLIFVAMLGKALDWW